MLKEISSAGVQPITLDYALQELRHAGRDDQTLVIRHANAAIRYVEREAQISLRPNVQWLYSLANWPTCGGIAGDHYDGDRLSRADWYRNAKPIRLARPPWKSTDSVKYFDTDDTEQTVGTANYNTVPSDTASALLEFDDSYSFPALRPRADAVNITYTTGTATPDPVGVSAALLMLHFYFDHDADAKAEADKLIDSLRLHSYGA